jgi:hypothetical protein
VETRKRTGKSREALFSGNASACEESQTEFEYRFGGNDCFAGRMASKKAIIKNETSCLNIQTQQHF